MSYNRREFVIGTTSLALCSSLFFKSTLAQDKKGTRIVLLGTKGGPRPFGLRRNYSTMLLINGTPYVVDCGYGTSQQLGAAGIPLNSVRYLFITHHHSDHNLDFGPLFYNTWVTGQPFQLDAYGPPGLKQMIEDFSKYMKFDIDTRMVDEGRPDPRKSLVIHEFDKPGLVFQNDEVKVTSTRVRHPPITQSYAYRFDAKDRSVVISGDTTYAPELVEFAKGADVLVHEVIYLPAIEELLKRLPNSTRLREHLVASHTTPEDIGRVAASAGVKTVVLTHFVPGDDASITDEMWSEGVRKNFKGRIVVGKDLLEI